MNVISPQYRPFGLHALSIEWPPKIDPEQLYEILEVKSQLEEHYIKVNVDIINTYNTITVFYNSTIENIYDEISTLKGLINTVKTVKKEGATLWKIPVCYDDTFAVDLEAISKEIQLSKSEIIKLHSTMEYTVYFIGFLPGFLYLGGLASELYIPRKNSPSIKIPSGAVGIGGSQTGIYPQESAGGWNIIGNSPISFFDRKTNPPCFVKAGDRVCFTAISYEEHQEICKLVAYKRYQIESEVLDA